jgi:hypothetical protein
VDALPLIGRIFLLAEEIIAVEHGKQCCEQGHHCIQHVAIKQILGLAQGNDVIIQNQMITSICFL